MKLVLVFLLVILLLTQKSECVDKIPVQNNSFWNNHAEFHNCYAYAFQDKNLNFTSKPQPGYKQNLPPLKRSEYTCENFKKALKADYPNLTFTSPCPCGSSAVFLALDTKGNFQDYHFYRQDRDGLWSHKPGSLPVQTTDYAGNLIFNPLLADRHDEEQPDVNYSTSCGFMCVKR